jgi:pyruvate,orthophosphate dikinase
MCPETGSGPGGAVAAQWVLPFEDGNAGMRELLGGKGANLAEMTTVLGPEVGPAGFTITTEACVAFLGGDGDLPAGLEEEIDEAIEAIEQRADKRLGAAEDPLLVSVRSGARESMPGMLDTVLNVGLNDESVLGLAAATGNERFAWDSYRRFVQMFGNVCLGLPGADFEALIKKAKEASGAADDAGLAAADLQKLTLEFKELLGDRLPQEPRQQVLAAVRAVFESWKGDRAVSYRRINGIPDSWGTAVNVQQMVFGNKGETSGSGVAFSRDEVTGAPDPSGDFLPNAQGEDVVSGVRTPRDIVELAEWQPEVHASLLEVLRTLERHYGDMQDTEFTVEEGRLYMLQSRNAKRPAQAAVRFAVDAVGEGLLDRAAALMTIDSGSLDALLHPTFDTNAEYEVLASGIAASPGAAAGEIVFTAPEAVAAAEQGREVILVRPFTEAEDVAGFHAAKGILTSEGGKASHAALVARGMGRPAVTGAGTLKIDLEAKQVRAGDVVLGEGDYIAIDGTAGRVTTDDVPLVEPETSQEFRTVLEWSDELRQLGVRANADTPEDAAKAVELGAEGIGLCRTEHMFLGDRQPKMAAVILAEDDEERARALDELRKLQEQDFREIFEAMAGRPVTIRLLDPPLHEFLPQPADLPEGSPERARVEAMQEVNPMLGTRGVRLGILHPEIYRMQVAAIFAAQLAAKSKPELEIMVPLVGYERELELTRTLIEGVGTERGLVAGSDYLVGTMIELPRACFLADEIARHADFFSFGTNDLTQTGLGFSRDDIEGRILGRYIDVQIFDRSPFETLDTPGVGQMVRMGAWLGRNTKPEIRLGVCGEHGGDPDSIDFFQGSGLDYVSCSPYRVPVARVAAAQAAIRAA